jgi:hypothetical protein
MSDEDDAFTQLCNQCGELEDEEHERKHKHHHDRDHHPAGEQDG